jgi:hypothetical protein
MSYKNDKRERNRGNSTRIIVVFVLFSLRMSNMTPGKKKIIVALSPKLFAFGGGTKPVSQLLFNKYDTDKSG